MALRTKNAIRRSFIELLAERPFDKISVRDIAERSEVTRNTFYYYYTDIYALAEDVFESEIEKLSERVEGYESWQKAFLTATSFAAENKRMILHRQQHPYQACVAAAPRWQAHDDRLPGRLHHTGRGCGSLAGNVLRAQDL